MQKCFGLVLLLLALATLSCGPKLNPNEIRIGEYAALTGAEATFGISTDNGIKLAIDEINAVGGISGKTLKLTVYDDQGKPEEAAVVTTKLITQDRVQVVLGEVASSLSLAAAPICQQNKVPMISPSSTNPKVTQVGDYVFRVCFIDPFQGQVMADFAMNHLKAKTAAVFRDQKSDYSMGLADFFVKRFKEKGGTIVTDQSYVAGDVDFKSQLTNIRGEKPDVIFVPGYYGEVGLIAKQAKELGIKVALLGGDGWDSSKLYEIGGAALDGCYFSSHYSPDSTDPHVKDFVKKYQAKYGQVPDALATLGYDAMGVLASALKNAKSLSEADIRDAIAATKAYEGVTGSISLDANRDAVKPAVVLKITNNKASYVTTVNP
ncbi:MAG TPA: ABC transporter substrate-binding protein [bacterium]|jgi:branched-chain amino acid transport system substrate-binding protein|nr:ABC transporter substrate-binding protein [bacterium]